MDEEERFNLDDDDGTFLMNYKNFRQVYDKLFVAQNFPDNWCAIRYSSKWTEETSGGLPLKSTEFEKKRYAKNP